MKWFADWWLRNYPYTNFHDMNDNWILNKLRQFEELLKKFGELMEKLYDEVDDKVNELINKYIEDGTLYVAIDYDAEEEALNIVVSKGGDNNG